MPVELPIGHQHGELAAIRRDECPRTITAETDERTKSTRGYSNVFPPARSGNHESPWKSTHSLRRCQTEDRLSALMPMPI